MSKILPIFALGLALAWHLPPKPNADSVYQYTSSAWYYSEWYTQPPSQDATRVYFQGEAIGVQVQIYNTGDERVFLTDVKPTMSQNFRPELLSAPGEAAKSKPTYDFAPNFELVPTKGEIRSIPPSRGITLGAKEGLVARLTIKTVGNGALPVGIYRYRIRSFLKAANEDIKVNNDDFTFEVRQVRSFDDRIELLRREATEAMSSGKNIDTARKKIDALLKLHPDSDVAYTLLGALEYNRGQLKLAISAYEKAIELMRTNKDTTVLKYKTKLVLEQAQGTVAATLRAWKQEQR